MAAGGAAGCDAPSGQAPEQPRSAPSTTAADTPVPPTGRYQAGVIIPQPAQPNLLAVVADIDDTVAPGSLLADLGQTVLALIAGTEPRLLGLPPGDLTITIGVGPRIVRKAPAAKTAGVELPGTADLPEFSREQIAPQARGGTGG